MDRVEWRFIRLMTLSVQNGRCATAGCASPARDVVLVGSDYRGFCRSCRLKLDGKSRARKARHTRIVRAAERSGQKVLFS